MEGKSQRSSLALNSGRTGVSLKRWLRRRRRLLYFIFGLLGNEDKGTTAHSVTWFFSSVVVRGSCLVTCHKVNVEATKVGRKITIHQYIVSKHVACVLSCELLTLESLSSGSLCIVFVDFISDGHRILYTGALRVGSWLASHVNIYLCVPWPNGDSSM